MQIENKSVFSVSQFCYAADQDLQNILQLVLIDSAVDLLYINLSPVQGSHVPQTAALTLSSCAHGPCKCVRSCMDEMPGLVSTHHMQQ